MTPLHCLILTATDLLYARFSMLHLLGPIFSSVPLRHVNLWPHHVNLSRTRSSEYCDTSVAQSHMVQHLTSSLSGPTMTLNRPVTRMTDVLYLVHAFFLGPTSCDRARRSSLLLLVQTLKRSIE